MRSARPFVRLDTRGLPAMWSTMTSLFLSLRDDSLSDETFLASACSQASFVFHADTVQVELSYLGGPVTSCQNTHAHSAWAVVIEKSRQTATSGGQTRRRMGDPPRRGV